MNPLASHTGRHLLKVQRKPGWKIGLLTVLPSPAARMREATSGPLVIRLSLAFGCRVSGLVATHAWCRGTSPETARCRFGAQSDTLIKAPPGAASTGSYPETRGLRTRTIACAALPRNRSLTATQA